VAARVGEAAAQVKPATGGGGGGASRGGGGTTGGPRGDGHRRCALADVARGEGRRQWAH
jgi:hypothetical protein